MRSPTQAILWEITARNRWALTFAFGAMPVCAVLAACTRWYYSAVGRPFPGEAGDVSVVVLMTIVFTALLSLTCIFWSFSFTHIDERGRFGGFPTRLFTLPLLTRSAAAPPVFAGVLAVVISYTVWASLLFILLRESGPPPWLRFAWQMLVLATAFVVMQAIIWLMHPFRFARMVVVALAGLALLSFFFWPPEVEFYQRPSLFFASGGVGLLAAIAGAFGVVAWERRGGWQNVKRISFVRSTSGPRTFAAPGSAQVWFECRRKLLFGAAAIGLTMTMALLVWTVPAALMAEMGEEMRNVEWPMFWILPLTTLLSTAAFGGAFGKSDPWGPDITMNSFHAVRPMRTAQLVFAKWSAALQMVVLAWGIFFITSLLITLLRPDAGFFIGEFLPQFESAHPALVPWLRHPIVLLTLFFLQWHAVVGTMSVVLSGNPRRVAVTGWIGILVLSAFGGVIAWFTQRPDHFAMCRPILPWLAAALVIFKVGCAIHVFKQARRELLVPGELIWMATAWVALTAGVAISMAMALSYNMLPRELTWFIAVWLMPSGEMPACVIHLAMNRHR